MPPDQPTISNADFKLIISKNSSNRVARPFLKTTMNNNNLEFGPADTSLFLQMLFI